MSKAKKTAAVVAKRSAILVYCGPTIPHVCNRFSMFSTVPEALNEKAKQVPLIRNLILPISELREARMQIEGRSGSLYAIYLEIKKSI